MFFSWPLIIVPDELDVLSCVKKVKTVSVFVDMIIFQVVIMIKNIPWCSHIFLN